MRAVMSCSIYYLLYIALNVSAEKRAAYIVTGGETENTCIYLNRFEKYII